MSDSRDDIALGADIWEPSQYSSSSSIVRSLPGNSSLERYEAPSLNELNFVRLGGVPQMPTQTPLRAAQLVAKRVFDITAAALLLLVFSPLLIGIAIAVKLTSPGPVFFLQERVGLGGAGFMIFKFRTMFADRGDASGVAQTIAGDARVTSIGRYLRRWSLDELPQLINVLLGNMSLVGRGPMSQGNWRLVSPVKK